MRSIRLSWCVGVLAAAVSSYAFAADDWLDEMPSVARVAQVEQQELGPADRRQNRAAINVAIILILLRETMAWQAATEPEMSAERMNRMNDIVAAYERAELAIGNGLGKRRGDLTPDEARAYYEGHAYRKCTPEECYAYWFSNELSLWGAYSYRQRFLPLLFSCERTLAFMKLIQQNILAAPTPFTPALAHRLSSAAAARPVSTVPKSCGISGLDVDGDGDCFDWEAKLFDLQTDGVRIEPSCAPLILRSATTEDGESITVKYTIGPDYGKQPVALSVCRAAHIGIKSCMDPLAELIGRQTLADPKFLTAGDHTETILSGHVLEPDTAKPFIVVVGDSVGRTSQTWFQKRLVGVLVHGYAFRNLVAAANFFSGPEGVSDVAWIEWMVRDALLESNTPEPWQQEGEAALKSIACYDPETFSFHWQFDSIIELKSIITARATELSKQIVAVATKLEARHEGDVVDLHLIGHSRGTVVISLLLHEWSERPVAALKGAYIRLTLLDPHPAHPELSPQEDLLPMYGADSTCWTTYYRAQNQLRDPVVIVPDKLGVRSIDVWYQQTPEIEIRDYHVRMRLDLKSAEDVVCPLNLWGKSRVKDTVINLSKAPLREHNLTSLELADGTVIGHPEVTNYYNERISRAAPSSCTQPDG